MRLVRAHRIPNQERLKELLATEGIDVAQATLSRDIRALGLAKAAGPEGHDHYVLLPGATDAAPGLVQLLSALFVGVDGVGHLLVVKTLSGGAQPLAAAIDRHDWDDVVGTIAGDDTILIITRSKAAGRAVHQRLTDLAGAS
jgi:transcriptional regulator of arginine metabolism